MLTADYSLRVSTGAHLICGAFAGKEEERSAGCASAQWSPPTPTSSSSSSFSSSSSCLTVLSPSLSLSLSLSLEGYGYYVAICHFVFTLSSLPIFNTQVEAKDLLLPSFLLYIITIVTKANSNASAHSRTHIVRSALLQEILPNVHLSWPFPLWEGLRIINIQLFVPPSPQILTKKHITLRQIMSSVLVCPGLLSTGRLMTCCVQSLATLASHIPNYHHTTAMTCCVRACARATGKTLNENKCLRHPVNYRMLSRLMSSQSLFVADG